MKFANIVFAGLILAAPAAQPALAHFLFARILPPAEGGRAVEVYFSELAEAGDARLTAKIAHTQLWLQQTPGQFEPLVVRKTPDRLRAHLPASGSLMVVGTCQYGVLARPNQTPFLLRYFPKAIVGQPAELNRLTPHGKVPLEIVPSIHGEELRLVALVDGKPLPKAEFVTVDAQLSNTKVTADENGQAVWKPYPGAFSIYVRNTRKESGEVGGQKYVEIREFATLAFTWPLERKDADPKAVALFEEAIAARAQWRDFPGFEAKVTGSVAGRRLAGTVTIDSEGKVTYSDNDPSHQEAVGDWVEEQLRSIVQHRLAGPATPDRQKPILRFAATGGEHPFGPLLIFDGGTFASSYRVKDRQITVVNRNLGKETLTITVLDNDVNKEGKFLPRTYQVQYWDAKTGQPRRTETFQNRWRRVGAWDLPVLNQVTTAGDAGLMVRSFTLSEHVLAKSK
jgi:hypothetical protein